MSTYNFDKEMFASLNYQELMPGYNTIGLSDLSTAESEAMHIFFHAAGEPLEEFNPDDILLVKANGDGILTTVYGASIFKRDDDWLIVKLGANEFPVLVENGEFVLGSMTGSINFAEKPIDVTVKDDEGEEKVVQFYPASVEFTYIPEDDEDSAVEYRVKCSWDASAEAKPATIKAKIKNGKSIAQYFRSVPTGGGSGVESIKMQELGNGRYEVTGVRSVVTAEYGTRYILQLADGRECWSRGNVDIQLKDRADRGQDLLTSGIETLLIVADCKQRKDGKWSVNCALREVRDNASPKPAAKPQAPAKPPAPAKELATAGASTDKSDIPF